MKEHLTYVRTKDINYIAMFSSLCGGLALSIIIERNDITDTQRPLQPLVQLIAFYKLYYCDGYGFILYI